MRSTDNKDRSQKSNKPIFSSLYDLLANIFAFITELFKNIFGIFTEAFNSMKDKASDAYQKFKEAVATEVLKQGVTETINKCKDTSNNVKSAFQQAIGKVMGLGENVKNSCTGFVKEGINQISELFNNTIEGSNKAIQNTMKTKKHKTLMKSWSDYLQGNQNSNKEFDKNCKLAVEQYSNQNNTNSSDNTQELQQHLIKLLAKTSVKKAEFSENDKRLVGCYYDAKVKALEESHDINTVKTYTQRLERFVTHVKHNYTSIKGRVTSNPYYQTTGILGNLVNSVFNALRPKTLISGQVEKCINSASIIGNAIITALSMNRVDTSANSNEHINNHNNSHKPTR